MKLAGQHPSEVSVIDRAQVINAGYYLRKADHLPLVKQLNAALAALPSSLEGYHPVVLSGIYEDIPAIGEILQENKYAIVADDLAKESRAFAMQVPEELSLIHIFRNKDETCNGDDEATGSSSRKNGKERA